MINELFLKFSAFYGSQFISKWTGIDIDMVKSEWADGLEQFKVETISKALDYVRENNEFPPSLPEFVKICKEFKPRPEDENLRLTHVHQPISEEKAKENLAKMKEMLDNSKIVIKDD
jgi:hypothetical protein